MLRTRLLHPQILEALAEAGHAAKIFIADGNWPVATHIGPRSRLVNLNLAPGVLGATQVLEVLSDVVHIQEAVVMEPLARVFGERLPAYEARPPVWGEFQRVLTEGGHEAKIEAIHHDPFFEACCASDVALTIKTAERAMFGDLLLKIGVVPEEEQI